MATTRLHFDSWTPAWRALRRKFLPPPTRHDCPHSRRFWRRILRKSGPVVFEGRGYCLEHCLEGILLRALQRSPATPQQTSVAHRVPLGLVLLSRQDLSPEQLRLALQAQRQAGHGKIGEWLQRLGFASEAQITAALARQWCCPVFRPAHDPLEGFHRSPAIPSALLRSSVMLPVDYVASSATLFIACGERLDYRVLYAIEQMLQCHTEPCLALPSLVHGTLESLSETCREREAVFTWPTDAVEFARIVRSYCGRVSATEIRLVACGSHVWVRLLRPAQPVQDLLLHLPSGLPPASYSQTAVSAI